MVIYEGQVRIDYGFIAHRIDYGFIAMGINGDDHNIGGMDCSSDLSNTFMEN